MFNRLNSNRVRRTACSMLAVAVFSVVGGCTSSGNDEDFNTTPRATNSSSVAVPNASRSAQSSSAADFDSVRSFPTGQKSSSLITLEIAGPRSIRANHQAAYQMKVTNLTDMPLRNVIVSSTNPKGFQPLSVQGSTTKPSDNALQYSVGDLGPNESKTIAVNGVATDVGTVDTCYSVQYSPPTLCTALQVTSPTLNLAVDAPTDTDICQPVTYRYNVKNTGSGTAPNVTLEEQLPDGLTTNDGKQAIMANLGDIPQGETRTATATLKAAKTGKFTGSAIARSEGDATSPVSTATAVHAPVLDIAVNGEASDYVGKQAPFKIVVTNKGDAPANNTRVQISHSADSAGVVSASGTDNNGVVSVGRLAPNESRQINAFAESNKGGVVAVIASAAADCATNVSQTAQTQFNTIPALLLETVDEVDPVRVGQTVTYDIKVTNQGSGPDTNINVKASIPDGEEYVSTDGPTQPGIRGGDLAFPIIPTLEPKQSITWKVTVKATKAADVQFKTTATSDGIKNGAEKTEPTKLY